MLIEGTILGLILGKIRGGKFSNLGDMQINGWTILILALLLQLTPIISEDFPFFAKYQPHIYATSIILTMICICMNLRKKGMWAFFVGILLNLIVIAFNGFQMPISFSALKLAGLDSMVNAIQSGDMMHFRSLEGAAQGIKMLAKFIPIPKPYPLPKVISIGDIFITLGLILFITGEMKKSKFYVRHRMIKHGYKGRI
ncbi:MAG: hypothetical protein K0R93_1500 [Anaerosolibacter sp.]|uniref:DUF5317 domain-containing protein n=1 Tax=Anaerosolibacter sp. TaxID=1872527 RepID=UPI00262F9BE8|nr:DUF5317 domain-containing protein [Anaerosolibacter sp.]MDF2546602.1 hypothetical protein [Anaerosolibacter sp.]